MGAKVWFITGTSRGFGREWTKAALERGDLKGRYEAYRIAMGRAGEMPFMSSDEIRRLENMPPHENLQMNPGKADGKDTNEKPTE